MCHIILMIFLKHNVFMSLHCLKYTCRSPEHTKQKLNSLAHHKSSLVPSLLPKRNDNIHYANIHKDLYSHLKCSTVLNSCKVEKTQCLSLVWKVWRDDIVSKLPVLQAPSLDFHHSSVVDPVPSTQSSRM
jgi:hypothetical protein